VPRCSIFRTSGKSWPAPHAAESRSSSSVPAAIVADAHSALPTGWRGFPVAGIRDLDQASAQRLGREWGPAGLRQPRGSRRGRGCRLRSGRWPPPAAHLDVLPSLPDSATVPAAEAHGARSGGRRPASSPWRGRRSSAPPSTSSFAFAPMMLAVADALQRGLLGRLIDVEVHLSLRHGPGTSFSSSKACPGSRSAVHSIHYLDLIRALSRKPEAASWPRTLGHPSSELAQTRTSAILDFGPDVRCNPVDQPQSRLRPASSRTRASASRARRARPSSGLGLLLNYPRGASRTSCGSPGAADPGGSCRLAGRLVSPMPSSAGCRTCSASPTAKTRASSARSRMRGTPWALVEACFRSSAAPATPVPHPRRRRPHERLCPYRRACPRPSPRDMPAEHAALPVWNAEKLVL